VVVIETVGVGQSETEVADTADTVAVVLQPASGDVLQFLKAGIMEVPDVLVLTKTDLGAAAVGAMADLRAALLALGATDTEVCAVSSVPPPLGIEQVAEALEAHRARLDLPKRRQHARRRHALENFAVEYGERGLRALGGRHQAEQWLEDQDPALDVPSLEHALTDRAERRA
jgi:LAO/AO transport system kinase